ncbi:hypothetical protein ABT126_16645 [Streptomyces sp. NPDC002012]|uniref:hypothetical protein n=1 Tax=unclassified Streptomyces TaxID=2593676 RepID=UPI002E12F421|nr:hypothetical protein OG609_16200 [Streptomyces sp. NBC_01224]
MTTPAEREVPPPPSMRDLLAACAAATAVSTPPPPSTDRAPAVAPPSDADHAESALERRAG